MPFDTTYHFSNQGTQKSLYITVPGGRDTTIELQAGDTVPGHAELLLADSLVNALQLQEPVEKPEKNTLFNSAPSIFFGFLAVYIAGRVWMERKKNDRSASLPGTTKTAPSPYQTYYGDALNFSDSDIGTVLQKHFIYFNHLPAQEKERFIERTQLFIADKIFKIHCNPGFKEMPILISAAAVQLTFGLKKYLLPNFTFIHVFPEEFWGLHPTIRVLEGNVSGHAINLSWKHFLAGYQNPSNGQNTGLHELAHALYYQTFIVEENVDRNFRDTFDSFTEYGNKVYEEEQKPGNDLYSDYALKNFQEFWAESIEIFFEKPWQLNNTYPSLYSALVELLNQDPRSYVPEPDSNQTT